MKTKTKKKVKKTAIIVGVSGAVVVTAIYTYFKIAFG